MNCSKYIALHIMVYYNYNDYKGREGNTMKKIFLFILIGVMLLSVGCGRDEEAPDENNIDQIEDDIIENGDNEDPEETEEEVDEIQEIVDSMTMDEKIGQLFIFGIDGTVMNENMINVIENNHIGGFVLFKDNIQGIGQTVELLNSLKEINVTNNDIPLFFSLDEEGGIVSRLSDFYLELPSAKRIGDINNAEISTEYGKILGDKVKELGFNMDYAPVLDINSNPNNPVIGSRSFGSDIDTVVNNGLKVKEGLNSTGVISIVKHFPGHGDTGTDSHIDLPVINKSLEELERLELGPFKEAIDEDVDGIMVAHILFPELDNDYPSSLSHNIITGLLREELSYDGVVISDDMTMGAIVENYSVEDASVKFLKAGGDILLICHGYENQINALNRVKEEINSGNITEDELNEKVYRIIKLKKKYSIQDTLIEQYNTEAINSTIQEFLNRIQ